MVPGCWVFSIPVSTTQNILPRLTDIAKDVLGFARSLTLWYRSSTESVMENAKHCVDFFAEVKHAACENAMPTRKDEIGHWLVL